jgi:hypothetical protein
MESNEYQLTPTELNALKEYEQQMKLSQEIYKTAVNTIGKLHGIEGAGWQFDGTKFIKVPVITQDLT